MENFKEVFEYESSFYVIDKDVNESRESYIERVWYILHNISQTNKNNLEELVRKSRIWSNMKILKCEY